MPKHTDQDTFEGSAQATFHGGPLEGAGMLKPREVYVDFGPLLGESPLAAGAVQIDGATFISQIGPPSVMTPGQVFTASITFKNTGTTTWTAGGAYELHSQNPPDNVNFRPSPVVVIGVPVAPGALHTFTGGITAPLVPGTYNFQWRMKHVGVVGYFGDFSANVVVVVTAGPPPPADNAAFVSQIAPPLTMTPGQTAGVTVVMNNTGGTTWTAVGLYKLASDNAPDNVTWGLSRVLLAATTAPAANATFTFTITAPNAAGTYNFQWRMTNDSVPVAFGASSTNVQIVVAPSGACTPLAAPTVTPWTPGSMTYGYVVVARATAGGTLIAETAEKIITNGPSPISASSQVAVSIPSVPGATSYELWRTTNAYTGSPLSATTKGLVRYQNYGTGGIPPVIFINDVGAPGNGATPPVC